MSFQSLPRGDLSCSTLDPRLTSLPSLGDPPSSFLPPSDPPLLMRSHSKAICLFSFWLSAGSSTEVKITGEVTKTVTVLAKLSSQVFHKLKNLASVLKGNGPFQFQGPYRDHGWDTRTFFKPKSYLGFFKRSKILSIDAAKINWRWG